MAWSLLDAGTLAGARDGKAAAPMFGYSDDPANVAAGAQVIRRGGGQVARVPIFWPDLEPHRLSYRWERMDEVYREVTDAGLTPLFAIYGAPNWARNPEPPSIGGGDDDRIYAPDDILSWQRLWRTLVDRYPGAIWQTWNEPNHPFGGEISPETAARVTDTAVEAAREVDNGVEMIGPAASPGVDGWPAYMSEMYGEIKSDVAIGANLYPRRPKRLRSDLTEDLGFVLTVAGQRPLWITEVGLSREQYGARKQRTGSVWVYRQLKRAGVAAAVFHRLAPPASHSAWEAGLAVTRGFEPRPVYRALRRVVRRSR